MKFLLGMISALVMAPVLLGILSLPETTAPSPADTAVVDEPGSLMSDPVRQLVAEGGVGALAKHFREVDPRLGSGKATSAEKDGVPGRVFWTTLPDIHATAGMWFDRDPESPNALAPVAAYHRKFGAIVRGRGYVRNTPPNSIRTMSGDLAQARTVVCEGCRQGGSETWKRHRTHRSHAETRKEIGQILDGDADERCYRHRIRGNCASGQSI